MPAFGVLPCASAFTGDALQYRNLMSPNQL
ncbi:MAG: hypothetical protein BWY92_00491 [Firmicutes bacterium ADurb.BinA052]|nr:MAG: hypothetical protein BWY92_00491 [Firmicutes bacterium ADurb.BinA052]